MVKVDIRIIGYILFSVSVLVHLSTDTNFYKLFNYIYLQ